MGHGQISCSLSAELTSNQSNKHSHYEEISQHMYLNKVFQSVDIQSTFKDCWLVKEPSLHNCLYRVIVTVQIQPQGYRLYSDFKLMNV